MKNLTKIQPEPETWPGIGKDHLEWMCSEPNNGIGSEELCYIVRLLIHKVNELTDEVERMKGGK